MTGEYSVSYVLCSLSERYSRPRRLGLISHYVNVNETECSDIPGLSINGSLHYQKLLYFFCSSPLQSQFAGCVPAGMYCAGTQTFFTSWYFVCWHFSLSWWHVTECIIVLPSVASSARLTMCILPCVCFICRLRSYCSLLSYTVSFLLPIA
jgi:hypothetical protein